MKTKKIPLIISLVLVFLILPQLSNAAQVAPSTPAVDCDTPYMFMHNAIEQMKNRIQNLTCYNVFLFNSSRNMLNDNSTCDGDCDCDQIRLRDRIQEMLQDFENCTMHQILNWFRPNE